MGACPEWLTPWIWTLKLARCESGPSGDRVEESDHSAFLTRLFQHTARFGIANKAVRVFLKEKAVGHEFHRRSLHGGNIALVVLIAFLERFARVAFAQTLGFCGGEWDKGTIEATKVRGAKTRRPYVPPHIGSERRPYFHRP